MAEDRSFLILDDFLQRFHAAPIHGAGFVDAADAKALASFTLNYQTAPGSATNIVLIRAEIRGAPSNHIAFA